jgi:hypothetical protein
MQRNNGSAYTEAAAAEDARLDAELRSIRRREDAAELTVREAADHRIAAMEAHLGRLRELREKHLGDQDQ